MWLWFTAHVELTTLVDKCAERILTNLFQHPIMHQLKIPRFLCDLRKIILQKYTGGSPQNVRNVRGFTSRFQNTPIAIFKSSIDWQTTATFILDCTEAAETRPISLPPRTSYDTWYGSQHTRIFLSATAKHSARVLFKNRDF